MKATSKSSIHTHVVVVGVVVVVVVSFVLFVSSSLGVNFKTLRKSQISYY